MLGKLLKYEYKAQVKMFCGLYAFGLLLSIVSVISNILAENNTNIPLFLIAKSFTYGVLVVLVVVLFATTLIYAILRYRNNLLKDEGYLMHTLPVKTVDLVLSKLITAVSWFCLDVIVAYVLISIANRDFTGIGSYLDVFTEVGFNNKPLVAIFSILFFLAAVVASLTQFYLSLSIGYTAYGSKDLMSFVAYIVIYVIAQIISSIILVVSCIGTFKSLSMTVDQLNSDVTPGDFMKVIFIASFIFSVILSVIELGVSVKVMDRKLNLE